MDKFVGKYQHEKNENLEDYFIAVGVPFIPRKLMLRGSPQLEISVDEQGLWTIMTSSMLRTTVVKFQLGEEYEEHMPGGVVIKSKTTNQDDQLVTESITPTGEKNYRIYDFSDTHCVITLNHEESGKIAKRYFKRQ